MKKNCFFLCSALVMYFYSVAQQTDKIKFEKAVNYLNCKVVGYALSDDPNAKIIFGDYKKNCNCENLEITSALSDFVGKYQTIKPPMPPKTLMLYQQIESLKDDFDSLSNSQETKVKKDSVFVYFLTYAIYTFKKYPIIVGFDNKRANDAAYKKFKKDLNDTLINVFSGTAILSGDGNRDSYLVFLRGKIDSLQEAVNAKPDYTTVVAGSILAIVTSFGFFLLALLLIFSNSKLQSFIKSRFEKTNGVNAAAGGKQSRQLELLTSDNVDVEERLKALERQYKIVADFLKGPENINQPVDGRNKKRGSSPFDKEWVKQKITEEIHRYYLFQVRTEINQKNQEFERKFLEIERKTEALKKQVGEATVIEYSRPISSSPVETEPYKYTPAPQPEQFKTTEKNMHSEIFFLSTPNAEGFFSENDASATYKEGASVYIFTKIAANRAEFQIDGRETSVGLALQFPDKIIDPVCEAQSAFNPKTKRIVTEKPGEAELIDGRWVVSKSQKAKIHYES